MKRFVCLVVGLVMALVGCMPALVHAQGHAQGQEVQPVNAPVDSLIIMLPAPVVIADEPSIVIADDALVLDGVAVVSLSDELGQRLFKRGTSGLTLYMPMGGAMTPVSAAQVIAYAEQWGLYLCHIAVDPTESNALDVSLQ